MTTATPEARRQLQGVDWLVERMGEDWDRQRVYRALRAGLIPHVRVGRYIRVDPARIESWIDAGGTGLED